LVYRQKHLANPREAKLLVGLLINIWTKLLTKANAADRAFFAGAQGTEQAKPVTCACQGGKGREDAGTQLGKASKIWG